MIIILEIILIVLNSIGIFLNAQQLLNEFNVKHKKVLSFILCSLFIICSILISPFKDEEYNTDNYLDITDKDFLNQVQLAQEEQKKICTYIIIFSITTCIIFLIIVGMFKSQKPYHLILLTGIFGFTITTYTLIAIFFILPIEAPKMDSYKKENSIPIFEEEHIDKEISFVDGKYKINKRIIRKKEEKTVTEEEIQITTVKRILYIPLVILTDLYLFFIFLLKLLHLKVKLRDCIYIKSIII